jgi:hypothetical protein
MVVTDSRLTAVANIKGGEHQRNGWDRWCDFCRVALALQHPISRQHRLANAGSGAGGGSRSTMNAIAKICNMVAGQFKSKIGLETHCVLAVPTIITGNAYELHSGADYDLENVSPV